MVCLYVPRQNPVSGALDSFRVIWPNLKARLAIVAMAVSQMAMVAVATSQRWRLC